MSKELSFRIVIKNPVEGIIYGLQKGKGSNFETVQAQMGNGHDLTFEFLIQVRQSNGSEATFYGPFVQGTPNKRFVYISIGHYAGQDGAQWSGRLKVPLPEGNIHNAEANADEYFWYCTVPGSTKERKPLYATVKPFDGWFMQKP